MSSWFSLNSFKKFQQESDQNLSENRQEEEEEEEEEEEDQLSPSHGGGVKEDLSEIGKTLSRQLWGVASFLAPPPPSSTNPTTTTTSSVTEGDGESSSSTFLGIRNDFAEISGSLKSGFSLISTNMAVNEISRLASNLLQFDEDGDKDDGVAGITEEALEFVREISLRPQCWIDFPLSLKDYDFDMSNVQREHALTAEHLTPSLADLRMKLCPSHISEEHFWMIYFILLHPRLNKHDSELLSTDQIVEVRDILLQTVQNRTNVHLQTSKADDVSLEVNDKSNNAQEGCSVVQENDSLAERVNEEHQEDVNDVKKECSGVETVNTDHQEDVKKKNIVVETVNTDHQEDVNADQWLEEEDETNTSLNGKNQLGNEEDVSFSDLEDDDSDTLSRQGATSPTQNVRSSPNDSSGWVQLSENSKNGEGRKKAIQPASRGKDSEGEESNEWLTIDEFDSDSAGTA